MQPFVGCDKLFRHSADRRAHQGAKVKFSSRDVIACDQAVGLSRIDGFVADADVVDSVVGRARGVEIEGNIGDLREARFQGGI